MKIGLLKEGKIPIDHRVPLAPSQARELENNFPEVKVIAQASNIRCFQDDEFRDMGIAVKDSIEECDVLLGVKEVPIQKLIDNKTYLFFSHTIKEQPYNQKLLQEIIRKKIRLIDYEVLTDGNGKRLVAFGRYAGIVGAYNGIMAVGKRYNLFDLRRANECFDLKELQAEYSKVKLPPLKILVTGGGRVTRGAMEVLQGMGIQKISSDDFLNREFDLPVFCQIRSGDYNKHKQNRDFSSSDFYFNPDQYESDFQKFTKKCDVLIAAAYWNPRAPVLFTRQDMLKEEFRIKVIADITCDIEGSIPSTKKATSIEEPFYDFDPETESIEAPFSGDNNISVMSIDNLPAELPRDASFDFGQDLMDHIIPAFLNGDSDKILERATITRNGKLTAKYSYLEDYVRNRV